MIKLLKRIKMKRFTDNLYMKQKVFFPLSVFLFVFISCQGQEDLFKNAGFPSKQTTGSSVTVYRIATDRIMHRFFGTSPISPSGRYLALFRVPFEDHTPEPGDS